MALRWPIVRLLVRATRSAKRSATATDGLGRSRFAIRLRTLADALRALRPALRTGNAEYSGTLFCNPWTRDHRRRWRGRRQCGIATSYAVDDRFCRRARLDHQYTGQPEPARWICNDRR